MQETITGIIEEPIVQSESKKKIIKQALKRVQTETDFELNPHNTFNDHVNHNQFDSHTSHVSAPVFQNF